MRETQRRSLAEKHILTSSIFITADREMACSICTLFTNAKHLRTHAYPPFISLYLKPKRGKQPMRVKQARECAAASSSTFTNGPTTNTPQGNVLLCVPKCQDVNSQRWQGLLRIKVFWTWHSLCAPELIAAVVICMRHTYLCSACWCN